jgi:hypothetical protein
MCTTHFAQRGSQKKDPTISKHSRKTIRRISQRIFLPLPFFLLEEFFHPIQFIFDPSSPTFCQNQKQIFM